MFSSSCGKMFHLKLPNSIAYAFSLFLEEGCALTVEKPSIGLQVEEGTVVGERIIKLAPPCQLHKWTK
jgi:hypothetical protein